MVKEIIGIVASFIVLVSFLLKGELKIRLVNIVGCVVWVVYGLLIHSISVWFMNGAVLFIHIYKIYKIKREKNNVIDKNRNS